MQIHWEAADPGAVARRLGALPGIRLDPIDDGFEGAIGDVRFEIVLASSPAAMGDRLETSDVHGSDQTVGLIHGPALAAIGYATVDAERYAAERGWTLTALEPDLILGAAAWAVTEQPRTLVLEPVTEGRIVASLVRLDEGPAALYIALSGDIRAVRTAVGARGGQVGQIAGSPLGPAFPLGGGPPWGPHLVVVVGAPAVLRAAGTIAP